MQALPKFRTAAWACVAVGLIAAASPAMADVFTETVPVTGPVTTINDPPDEPGIEIFAPAFDQTLGTVTALSAEWSGALDVKLHYIDVSGTTDAPQSVEATGRPYFSIDTASVFLAPITFPVVCQRGACHSAATGVVRFDQTFDLAAAPDPFPLPADATIDPPLAMPVLPPPLNPGNIFDNSVLHSSVTFTFTYTPAASVPEPASWALLLAGGLGVMCATRRRSNP